MNDVTWQKELKNFQYSETRGPRHFEYSNASQWEVIVAKGDTEIRAWASTLVRARDKAIALIKEREVLRVGEEAEKAKS